MKSSLLKPTDQNLYIRDFRPILLHLIVDLTGYEQCGIFLEYSNRIEVHSDPNHSVTSERNELALTYVCIRRIVDAQRV